MKQKTIIISLIIVIILLVTFLMLRFNIFGEKKDFGTIYYTDFVSGSESNFNYYQARLRQGEKHTTLNERTSFGRDKLFFIDRKGKEHFISDETLRKYTGVKDLDHVAEIKYISPDDRLAMIYTKINPSLIIYDLTNSEIVTELKMEKDAYLTSGNFSNDSKSFIYGYNGIIYEFNLETKKSLEIATGDKALFSPDNKLISIIKYYDLKGGKVDIINRYTKKDVYSFELKKGVFQIFWANDSRHLIFAMQQGPLWTLMNIYMYDVKNGELDKVIKNPMWSGGLPRGIIYRHEY